MPDSIFLGSDFLIAGVEKTTPAPVAPPLSAIKVKKSEAKRIEAKRAKKEAAVAATSKTVAPGDPNSTSTVPGGDSTSTNQDETDPNLDTKVPPVAAVPKEVSKDLSTQFGKTLDLVKAFEQRNTFTGGLNLQSNYTNKVFYRIIYEEALDKFKSYNFVLQPARETKVGNWNVPEVKPGLPLQVKMKHKMQVIPGAGPLIQTIGISGTTVTLVGALVGLETRTDFDKSSTSVNRKNLSLPDGSVESYAREASLSELTLTNAAYAKVDELLSNLVYPGRPVVVEIKGANNQSTLRSTKPGTNDLLRFTGVVTGAKIHYVMADRCYYALDLFLTSYPKSVIEPKSFYDLTAKVTGVPDSKTLDASQDIEKIRAKNAKARAQDIKIPLNTRNTEEIIAEIKRIIKKPTLDTLSYRQNFDDLADVVNLLTTPTLKKEWSGYILDKMFNPNAKFSVDLVLRELGVSTSAAKIVSILFKAEQELKTGKNNVFAFYIWAKRNPGDPEIKTNTSTMYNYGSSAWALFAVEELRKK